MSQITDPHISDAATVAAHNDSFRKSVCAGRRPDQPLSGQPEQPLSGQLVVTRAIAGIDAAFLANALSQVGSFDSFERDNDPDGIHDVGAVEIEGERVLFKIDLFEAGSNKSWGAETPDKAETVERVLTIMLASDW